MVPGAGGKGTWEGAAAKANEMCIKIKNDKSWQIKITHTHTHARTHSRTHICVARQITCIQNGVAVVAYQNSIPTPTDNDDDDAPTTTTTS